MYLLASYLGSVGYLVSTVAVSYSFSFTISNFTISEFIAEQTISMPILITFSNKEIHTAYSLGMFASDLIIFT